MDIEKKLWGAAVALFEGDEVAAEHWLKQPPPALAACRTFPGAGRIVHRSWNLTV